MNHYTQYYQNTTNSRAQAFTDVKDRTDDPFWLLEDDLFPSAAGNELDA